MPEIKTGRKTIFYGLLLLFVYVTAELTEYAGYAVAKGNLFSWSSFQDRREDVMENSGFRKRKARESRAGKRRKLDMDNPVLETIHPYVGFVLEANRQDCSEYGFCDRRVVGNRDAPVNRTCTAAWPTSGATVHLRCPG